MHGSVVPATAPLGPDPRRDVGGRLRTFALAPGRALAFAGLTAAGAVLLVITVGPVALAALGLAQIIDDLWRQGAVEKVDGKFLIGVLIGLAGCRFVLPAALLSVRRLARLTRRLTARWYGVTIGEAYVPAPATGVLAGGTSAGELPSGALAWVLRGPGGLRYRRRMAWLLNDPATWRDLFWLAANAIVGPTLLLGPFVVAFAGGHALFAGPDGHARNLGLVLIAAGVLAGMLAVSLTLRGYVSVARLLLAPSESAELEQRVAYLAQTRQESLDTGAAELRRIERDLHDGAQARLVSMGLTLDAAGRLIDTDQAAARALLLEARDASSKALAELRDLVRGVHPPVLADRGLADAIRALALDSPVRTLVTGSLHGRPPAPVESAAYFAVSELLANVAKHAGASSAEIDLRHTHDALRITVRDDGMGGASPSHGTGLAGVERRLAAFDGVLAISSPVGGPTVITMEVPCQLS